LGFANFYKKFIKSYSKIVLFLIDLTKKNIQMDEKYRKNILGTKINFCQKFNLPKLPARIRINNKNKYIGQNYKYYL
jgi:hypothetical protein